MATASALLSEFARTAVEVAMVLDKSVKSLAGALNRSGKFQSPRVFAQLFCLSTAATGAAVKTD